MKLKADLTFNGTERRPFLMSGPSEPDDHLAHRLAAFILFWNDEPTLDATTKTPALSGFEFLPDLLATDAAGEATLWIECGSVTMNKLTKVTRRMPRARIVIIKENERSAQQLRKDLQDQFDRPERVEILAWPGNSYKEWAETVGDSVEGFGEADGRTINGVVNEKMVVVEFKSF
ncbi:MAG: YaeQ family protein [Elusimicrobiota bacterium]|nr:MAG: YaeQ family protein [Elusimicrobiota bacterium]